MTDVTLGIDVGTSGVRIMARDLAGKACAVAQAPMAAPLQSAGHALQDPQIWWQALQQAFAQLDLKGLTVKALAIDGTSGTVLPATETGDPLGLASMYNDVAEAEHVAKVAAVAPPETAALGATSPLARAQAFPATAPRILHQADWLLGRLLGRFDVTDENNALKTGYDPLARRWPDWIARTGLDMKRLPRVVAAGEKIGSILPAMAKSFGLPSETILAAGTTDGCAAFLASGAAAAGDGVTSLGTTLTLKLLSATPVFAPAFGIYSHRIADMWLAGGASNTGGGVLAAYFNRALLESLSQSINPDTPTGLDYYPLSKPGERFPVNDAALAPRLAPRPADDATFLQAMLEGMAAIEARAYGKLKELGASPLGSIRSLGGGAANAAWTRIRLKALNVPALEAASTEAAMGTARLAWWGLGHHV
jgi:sugar (pentulose or hexulose) kinase